MRILLSPTAFKGTLTPFEAARLLLPKLKKKFPTASITTLPLADGGDGTLDVLTRALKGKTITSVVEGPLGKKISAKWTLAGRTAIIEMARASGLALVKKNRIMEATSKGTGQIIKAALDRGCRKIILGVGGTACSEGGAGALQALGLTYFDKEGHLLSARPTELARLARIDWKNFDPRIKKTKIFILCDVRNPLLGPLGSAHTFGPQKGATPRQVIALEKMLKHWAGFAPKDVRKQPGVGAAGALAFGLAGFAGAKLTPGTHFIMKMLKWKNVAKKCDVIVTGEGCLDKTSFHGKVIGEILNERLKAHVIAICGSSRLTFKQAWKAGLEDVIILKEFV